MGEGFLRKTLEFLLKTPERVADGDLGTTRGITCAKRVEKKISAFGQERTLSAGKINLSPFHPQSEQPRIRSNEGDLYNSAD